MLESSLKSSAYFDLSQGSFYEAESQFLEDTDATRTGLKTRAVLRHFPAFSVFCDFAFLLAAFALSPLSFGTILKAPSTSNDALIGIFLTVFSVVIFYFGKLYRIETTANFRFFCTRFAMILFSVLAAGEIENFMVSSGTSHTAAYNQSFFLWAGVTLCLFLALRFVISEAFRFLAAQDMPAIMSW